ncbi:hypothetical protein MLD38_006455 [Melastoma candidum]|uniref:Uncharacterized protein n=1 Tax=Melastoma candidum TaxID=119954 RepID=A0ACB9RNH0_9MYRT|nr:hypothetical protein MLD38_006455 [Melastoma candidum]
MCRRHEDSVKKLERDPCMDVYLKQAGFPGIAKLPFIQLDWLLIIAFIKTGRPETHSFHMVFEVMTITLQDVQIHLGLPIEKDPVTSCISVDFTIIC